MRDKHIEHVKGETFILSVWLHGDKVGKVQVKSKIDSVLSVRADYF